MGVLYCKWDQSNLKRKIIPKREKGKPLNWNYEGEDQGYITSVDYKMLKKYGCKVELLTDKPSYYFEE